MPASASCGGRGSWFQDWPGVVLVFLGAAALLFGHLGHFPLVRPDEVRNAEVGREMFASGSWLVPTYNGLPYLDKPAFHFKSIALSFALFGVNEAAARLPSALSGLAILLAAFLFARRVYGRRAAVLAVLITGTIPLFVVFSRLVILDMMFTLCVCLAIFAGFLAEEREARARLLWHLAGAAAAGVAALIKGPVGLVLPWLVLTLYFLLDRRPRAILRLFAPQNLLVILGLVLPWFLLLSERHPDFPRYALVNELLQRLAEGSTLETEVRGRTEINRGKPFLYYLPLIAGTFFTWSMLLPESMLAAWRARRRWSRADRLCIVWACAVVVFFSLPHSKQPGYILSVTVPAGLLLARTLAGALDGSAAWAASALRRGTLAVAAFGLVIAGVSAAVLARPEDATRWFDSPQHRVDLITPHLPALCVACVLLAVLAVCAFFKRSQRLGLLVFAAFFPIVGATAFDGIEAYALSRSERSVPDRIPALPPETQLVSLQCFPLYVPFYLQRQVTLVTQTGREFPSNYLPYALTLPGPWPAQVVPWQDWPRWFKAQRGPLFVIGNSFSRDILDAIARTHGTVVHDLSRGFIGVLVERPGGR